MTTMGARPNYDEHATHRDDPASSYSGEKLIKKKRGSFESQIAEIYAALLRFPMHTARELSVASGIDYYVIQKRIKVLESRGKAVRHHPRLCTVSGTDVPAHPWEAIPEDQRHGGQS